MSKKNIRYVLVRTAELLLHMWFVQFNDLAVQGHPA